MSTVKMQIRLAPSVIAHFTGLTPCLKGRAVAAVLTGAIEGVDLRVLLDAVEELRKGGVNLNQAVHLAHIAFQQEQPAMPPETVARVNEYLDFLDRIRGRA